MSLPRTTDGYGVKPGEDEALWFNGGLGVLRATGDQTGRALYRDGAARAKRIRLTTPHPPT
jgi:hypothetical protein